MAYFTPVAARPMTRLKYLCVRLLGGRSHGIECRLKEKQVCPPPFLLITSLGTSISLYPQTNPNPKRIAAPFAVCPGQRMGSSSSTDLFLLELPMITEIHLALITGADQSIR